MTNEEYKSRVAELQAEMRSRGWACKRVHPFKPSWKVGALLEEEQSEAERRYLLWELSENLRIDAQFQGFDTMLRADILWQGKYLGILAEGISDDTEDLQ